MFQKQKQLAIFNENIENLHVIENNTVIVFLAERGRKSAGGKNEGFSHYIIENTRGQKPKWGIHLTQVTTIYSIAADGRLSSDDRGVGGALSFGAGVPGVFVPVAVADGVSMSKLRGRQGLVGAFGSVAVCRL